MSDNNLSVRRNLWETPWGYVESFLIGFGLLITGFSIEYFVKPTANFAISYPYNLYFLFGYILVLIVTYFSLSNSQLVRWLTKVPASISSIVWVTVLVMVMGIIPQIPSENSIINALGLNHITTNWAFLLILLQFLTCLGLITIKRIAQFQWKNIGFILNHFGLFLALIAGVLGTGDLQRLSIETVENEIKWKAYNSNNQLIELPFAFYLKDFKIEEYNPKLALIENKTGKVLQNEGQNLFLIEKNKRYNYQKFEVQIEEFYTTAGKIGNRYAPVNELGSPPAALIKVINKETDTVISGWISCGSFIRPYQALKLNETYSMVMTIPETKKFSSSIDILNPKGDKISTVLEVNKPFKYEGWKIYQLSYDEKMGKWSQISVLELVKDPWLPVIYLGIFMMIAGAIYMFWMGSKITKRN